VRDVEYTSRFKRDHKRELSGRYGNFGTPDANPEHFDETRSPTDMAMFDLDRAAGRKKNPVLGFTCIRP
jgi:hypothetical protein